MTGRSVALALSVLLGACTVGPDYVAPADDVPGRFAEQPASGPAAPAAEGMWWRNLGDPLLDDLVEQALGANDDLAAAKARIVEARAERAAVAAQDGPEVALDGAYARQHGSANVPIGTPPGGLGPNLGSNLYLAGFDAAWELDLFGGTRRAVESADAALDATIADRRAVALTLVAEVARNYVELRAGQRRLAIAQQLLALRRDTLHLVTAQFDSGLVGALDKIRAEADLADSEAEIPALDAALRGSIYRLGVLVGKPPEAMLDPLLPPLPIPAADLDVPPGLPSDLLKRRPDIRAAERRIAAASARIGVREADLYPHFSLTGDAGFESLDARTLFSGGSRYFSVGPSVRWLVFDAGRIRDEVLAERARTDAAAAVYRKTVLTALSEVESALVTYGRQQIRRAALQREVTAAQQAVDLATRLYARGLQDFLTVLDAERSLHAAETGLADSQGDVALALIALYKALGGDWAGADTK